MKDQIDRIDGYLKMYFQAIVAWFTFFVTVNWASIGWLAANFSELKNNILSSRVSCIFGWQNILGIFILICALVYFNKQKKELEKLEISLYKNKLTILSFRIIFASIVAMIFAIVPMCILWFWVAYLVH